MSLLVSHVFSSFFALVTTSSQKRKSKKQNKLMALVAIGMNVAEEAALRAHAHNVLRHYILFYRTVGDVPQDFPIAEVLLGSSASAEQAYPRFLDGEESCVIEDRSDGGVVVLWPFWPGSTAVAMQTYLDSTEFPYMFGGFRPQF